MIRPSRLIGGERPGIRSAIRRPSRPPSSGRACRSWSACRPASSAAGRSRNSAFAMSPQRGKRSSLTGASAGSARMHRPRSKGKGGPFGQSDLALRSGTVEDAWRGFVRSGTGARHILLRGSEGFRNQAWPPYKSPSGYFISVFRLAATEICVDLSPGHSMFPILKEQAMQILGKTGWTWLPIGK